MLRTGDSMIVRLQRLIEDKRPSADLRATIIYVTPEVVEVGTPRKNISGMGANYWITASPPSTSTGCCSTAQCRSPR